MTVRFDLPELMGDSEDQEDCSVEPCFPYQIRNELPGDINLWCPVLRQPSVRSNIQVAGRRCLEGQGRKKNGPPGRVLLQRDILF